MSTAREGLKGELDFEVNPLLWDEISRQRELCLGGKCPFPPLDGVVFDEVASHYLGGEVSNYRIIYLLNEIHNPFGRRKIDSACHQIFNDYWGNRNEKCRLQNA